MLEQPLDAQVFCFKFLLLTPVVPPDAADMLLEWLTPEVVLRGYTHKVVGVCDMLYDVLRRTSSFTVVTASEEPGNTVIALRWPTHYFSRATHATPSVRQLVEEDPRLVHQRVQRRSIIDQHKKLIGTKQPFASTPLYQPLTEENDDAATSP